MLCKGLVKGIIAMLLDLTSFEKAVASLEASIDAYSRKSAPEGSVEKETMRDGVIQRFEYTFELSWKMIKRYLEMYSLEKPDGFTNKELFRMGFEQGLIRDAEDWLEYQRNRNLTSHTYDKATAEEVHKAATEFLNDAGYLLKRLKEKTR